MSDPTHADVVDLIRMHSIIVNDRKGSGKVTHPCACRVCCTTAGSAAGERTGLPASPLKGLSPGSNLC
jgi:hypothetical protein